MDSTLSLLLSWQFLFFCLGIASVVFVIRTIVEYIFLSHNLKIPMVWTEVILPILPVILGVIFSYFARRYPFPDTFGASISGRIDFGLVGGLLSGLVYRVLRALLLQKVNSNVSTLSTVVSNLAEDKDYKSDLEKLQK